MKITEAISKTFTTEAQRKAEESKAFEVDTPEARDSVVKTVLIAVSSS